MNIEDLTKKKGNEEAVKNQYFNYSNPEADTNLDDLANGVSKVDVAYGSNLDQQTVQGRSNYTDEVNDKHEKNGKFAKADLTAKKVKQYKDNVEDFDSDADRLLKKSKKKKGEGDSGRIMSDNVYIDPDGKIPIAFFEYKASHPTEGIGEGGYGSGRRFHRKFMNEIETGGNLRKCIHCEVISKSINDVCDICGQYSDY